MNKEQLEQIKEIIKENESSYDFNDSVLNFSEDYDLIEMENSEDIRNYLEDLNQDGDLTNTEVTYHGVAIEYLADNDPSLNESLSIASEFGYTTENLNSELLASLLKSQNNKEDYGNFIDEVVQESEQVLEVNKNEMR